MPRGKSTRKAAAKVSPKKEKKPKDEDEEMEEAEETTSNTNATKTPKATQEVDEQSDEEDDGDTNVGSLPLSLGRSGSMHSLRIKEKQDAGKLKTIVTKHVDHKYAPKDFVAVSNSSEEKFWIGRVNKVTGVKKKKLHVNWLEAKQDNNYFVEEDENDTIEPFVVLTKVTLTTEKDGSFTLSKEEKARIIKLVDSELQQDNLEEDDEEEANDDDGEFEIKEEKIKEEKIESDDDDIKDEPEEEEAEEEEEKPKKRAPRRASTGSRGAKTPTKTAGRGRKRKAEGSPDDEPKPKKQKAPPKPKRVVSKPKKPEPNPDIPVVDLDPVLEAPGNTYPTNCCNFCSSKQVIRAVLTKNTTLLKKLINDSEHVYNLYVFQSADTSLSALDHAIINNDHDAIKLLTAPYNAEKKPKRAPAPHSSLKTLTSGSVSKFTYNHAVRPITATRGGKEGNNAFADDLHNGDYWKEAVLSPNIIAKTILNNNSVTKETLDLLLANIPGLEQQLSDNVYFAVRAGNHKVAGHVIENLVKKGGFGFNPLHYQVALFENEELEKFRAVSVTKKPYANKIIAPLHTAAINPNPKYLKALLDVVPEYNYPDEERRKPIHYAAACSSPEPLKFLIARGVDFKDGDDKGITPLNCAVHYGRLENVEVILKIAKEKEAEAPEQEEKPEAMEVGEGGSDEEEGSDDEKPKKVAIKKADSELGVAPVQGNIVKQMVEQGDKFGGWNSIHTACYYGQDKVLKYLIDTAQPNLELLDKKKRTPLHIAALRGNYECVKVLIEAGALIDTREKLKKTPLLLAAKNGYLKIVSYLVHVGSDPNAADSSKNTPAHYAAGYGWLEVLKYLVQHGADPNLQNDWKSTPLSIAMFKGHLACADFLLNQSGVDVNIRDESGRSLLSQTIDNMTDDKAVSQMKYLLDKEGIDVNLADTQGLTPLHLIATRVSEDEQILKNPSKRYSYWNPITDEQRQEHEEKKVQFNESVEKIARMLIEKGADVLARDSQGQSPLMLATLFARQTLIKLLLDNKAEITGKNQKDQNILHLLAGNNAFFDTETVELLEILVKNKDFPSLISEVDDEGATPLLKALVSFKNYTAPSKDANTVNQKPQYGRKRPAAVKSSAADNEDAQSTDNVDKEKTVAQLKNFLKCLDIVLSQPTADASNAFIKLAKKRTEKKLPPHKEAKRKQKWAKMTELQKRQYEKKKYGPFPQWTALHLVASKPAFSFDNAKVLHNEVLRLLLNKKPQLDKVNLDDETPLHLSVNAKNIDVAKSLIGAGADVNRLSLHGDSALTIAIKQGSTAVVEDLINHKAKVDIADQTFGLTPLHIATTGKNLEMVKLLLSKGANPNSRDKNQRTALHFAVSISSATVDATFDMEETLLNAGADVNAQDVLGCTPLHYAFIDMNHWHTHSKSDPIETVSSMCAIKNININLVDKHQRTALHWAAKRGATICSLYLIERGSELDKEDYDNNTPLGIGVKHGHFDYAIMLIQKKASVKHLVNFVERITKEQAAKEAKQDEKKRAKLAASAMSEIDEDEVMHDDMSDVDEDEDMEEDDQDDEDVSELSDSDEDSDSDSDRKPKKRSYNHNTQKTASTSVKTGIHAIVDPSDLVIKERSTKTMFSIAIAAQNSQGLTYMMLDAGFDYLSAMKDALAIGRLQLVVTLLSKTKEDSIVQKVSDKKQNLFHALGQSPATLKDNRVSFTTVAEKLLARGVDIKLVDNKGRSALHYAAKRGNKELCEFFLQKGLDANLADKKQQTPFSLAIQNSDENGNLIKLFKKHKANVNTVFLHEQRKITPLIYCIKQLNKKLAELILATADVNAADDQGRTPLMYAVSENAMELIDMLLKKKGIDVNKKDSQGKNVVHYVVNPLPYGSYENVALLELLHKRKAELDVKDNSSKAPLYYASLQDSKKLFNSLRALGVKALPTLPTREQSSILAWADSGIDYEHDAKAYVKSSEQVIDEVIPHRVDKVFGDRKQRENCEVYSKSGVFYDVLLTKVDIDYGIFGRNNFYVMQVIHDKLKDLYILWNKWGRIGTVGQYQQTPFNTAAEACTEFEKIFRSKTGNPWASRDSFEKKHKKYNLVKFQSVKHNVRDLLEPFALSVAPASALPDSVKSTMTIISNLKRYKQAVRSIGIDTDVMPLNRLTKDALFKARDVLLAIKDKIDELKQLQQKGVVNQDIATTIHERIAVLTNEFYELIPHTAYTNGRIESISEERGLKVKLAMVNNLIDLEVASKIFLGALSQQQKMNPLDYVYKALNLDMEELGKESPEFKILLKYARNTDRNAGSQAIDKIYRIQRKGEAERISKWKETPNHFLLWHGSKVVNFVGIMSQGLRIAPPEAEGTGALFGRGIYFADTFSKSYNYTDFSEDGYGFMMLCEVALGKMKQYIQGPGEELEAAPAGFDSVQGLGSTGPNFEQSLVLPNGVTVPVGSLEDKKTKIAEQQREAKKKHDEKKAAKDAENNNKKAKDDDDAEGDDEDAGSDVEEVEEEKSENDEDKDLINANLHYLREYNEYIVYDTSQVRMRYLIQLKRK
jgi:ankyrin repeat protein/predicted DNA-binding WGR domain protein